MLARGRTGVRFSLGVTMKTAFEKFQEDCQRGHAVGILVPPMLFEMRWVCEYGPSGSDREGTRLARLVMKQNLLKFLRMMTSVEEAWLGTVEAAEKCRAALEENERLKRRQREASEAKANLDTEAGLEGLMAFLQSLNEYGKQTEEGTGSRTEGDSPSAASEV